MRRVQTRGFDEANLQNENESAKKKKFVKKTAPFDDAKGDEKHNEAKQDDLRIFAATSTYTINKPETLEAALLKGVATKTVKPFLQAGTDLNAILTFKLKDEDVSGTPLALAAALCSTKVVMELLQAGADLRDNNAFSWVGGLFATLWQGPASFACVMADRVDNLRVLAKFKAQLDGHTALLGGEARGTLLYEACCGGRAGIVNFLTQSEVNVDEIVTHPLDPGLRLTALHGAARNGFTEISRILIMAGADLNFVSHSDSSKPATPLGLAIKNGQFEVVKVLIEGSADLWSVSHDNVSHCSRLFEMGNLVTIAYAAAGLKSSDESVMRNLDPAELVRFLLTPGEAPYNILQAIFIPRTIKHWKNATQVDMKTAHLRQKTGNQDSINVAQGPDFTHFDHQFLEAKKSSHKLDRNYAQEVTNKEKTFLHELLPQIAPHGGHRSCTEQVPVDILQCVLPNLHLKSVVLHALAHSPSERVFDDPGCQAIILLAYYNVRPLYMAEQVVHVAYAVVFGVATVSLSMGGAASDRWWYVVILSALWVYSFLSEVMQLVGYRLLGKSADYFNSNNAVDALTLGLSLYANIVLGAHWEWLTDPDASIVVRLAMGFAALLRWFRVLNGLRVSSYVGPRMLPILLAAEDVFPFLSAVIFPLIGVTHFYYLLGVHARDKGMLTEFMIMYRLGILNDFDMEELGGPDSDASFVAACVRGLLVVATFAMAIIMMNIFIGILGESYAKANDTRDRLFVRTRAQVVFNFNLRWSAWKKSGRCCRRRKATVDGTWDYLWYCRHSTKVPQTLFVDDDAVLDAGQQRVLAGVFSAQEMIDRQTKEMENLKVTMSSLASSVAAIEAAMQSSRGAENNVASHSGKAAWLSQAGKAPDTSKHEGSEARAEVSGDCFDDLLWQISQQEPDSPAALNAVLDVQHAP